MTRKPKSKTKPAAKPKSAGAVEVSEAQLDGVAGGIALLLPAVQKVREAAANQSSDPDTLTRRK